MDAARTIPVTKAKRATRWESLRSQRLRSTRRTGERTVWGTGRPWPFEIVERRVGVVEPVVEPVVVVCDISGFSFEMEG